MHEVKTSISDTSQAESAVGNVIACLREIRDDPCTLTLSIWSNSLLTASSASSMSMAAAPLAALRGGKEGGKEGARESELGEFPTTVPAH